MSASAIEASLPAEAKRKPPPAGAVPPGFEVDSEGGVWLLGSYDMVLNDLESCIGTLATLASTLPGDRSLNGLRCRIPPEIGRGVVDIIPVSPRAQVMRVDGEYRADHRLTVQGERFAKIRVLLSGSLSHGDGGAEIRDTGAYLEAYPGGVDNAYLLAGGMPTRLVIVSCRPSFFTQDIGCPRSKLPLALRRLCESGYGPPIGRPTPLGPDLLRAASDLFHVSGRYPPHLRQPYMYSRVHEIGCIVARELDTGGDVDIASANLSVRDVNRAYEARDILAERYAAAPTIAQLARAVGLNQTKLKLAFRQLFDTTIASFTLRCRMERAAELLIGSSLSVSEIAYATGYDYPANLTHAFRRYYGQTPRQLRRERGAADDVAMQAAGDGGAYLG